MRDLRANEASEAVLQLCKSSSVALMTFSSVAEPNNGAIDIIEPETLDIVVRTRTTSEQASWRRTFAAACSFGPALHSQIDQKNGTD